MRSTAARSQINESPARKYSATFFDEAGERHVHAALVGVGCAAGDGQVLLRHLDADHVVGQHIAWEILKF
jgi:NAD(P)H-hydrate repair Nnr-like enzyme with NAD(P)H-hydrate epimerase domain